MESLELKNKVAVIAGASQGIGAEIGKLFARHGARVILLATREQKLKEVVDSIQDEGGEAVAFPMDVSVTEKWDELASLIRGKNWSWDILINNAYWRTYTRIGEVSDADFDRTIAVSLKASFVGARTAIPFMLKAGGGSIVNISSLQARIPEPQFGAYAVAKSGMEGLTRVLARDYAPTIRANTLVPGAVDTPGFAEGEEVKIELGKRLPLGRIGYALEIAETALFLASPHSSFITGAEIVADGGRSIT